GLIWVAFSASAQSALAANNTLHYYGGPVAHSMNVVLVEWGSSVRSTYTDSNTGDPAFFSYLASQSGSTMDIGGVLAQYMDTTGKNSQNAYSYDEMAQITPPTSRGPTGCKLPSCVDDTVIQPQLDSNINASTLPPPAGNGLSTINGPLVAEATINGPPLAWYNTSGGEIGDICVGANEQAPNGPWTVQTIWSNLDNNCVAGESSYNAPTASFLAPSVAALSQLTT